MTPTPDRVARARPVYLNLLHIRQPVPAIVSILHRISGAGLVLIGLPVLLWLMQTSLSSEQGFARVRDLLQMPLSKLVLLGLVWAYMHHFCAGIRYLLLDVQIGEGLRSGRQSAMAVLIVSLALTLIFGAWLW